MKIALYYAPNTCALAPYITLTEAGADFEVAAELPQAAEFLARVPEDKSEAQGACACGRRQDIDRERRHPSMDPSHLPRREDPARRSVGRVAGDLAACLVCQRHSPLSEPDQQPAQSLRRSGCVR